MQNYTEIAAKSQASDIRAPDKTICKKLSFIMRGKTEN